MALLARAMTPLPLQPGWLESVSFSRSLLPSGTISRQAAHRTDLRLDQHRVHPVLGRLDRLECGSPWTEPGGRGRLIGVQVTITTRAEMLTVIEPVTGEVLAEHRLVVRVRSVSTTCTMTAAAGPATPGTQAQNASGERLLRVEVAKLGTELADILAHGETALAAALQRGRSSIGGAGPPTSDPSWPSPAPPPLRARPVPRWPTC